MEKQEEIKQIVEILFNRFGSFKLSKCQAARVVGVSTSTVDRQRKAGTGIRFQQETETSNVFYKIHAIAEYIVMNDIKVV
jgi:methylphosphotriester-DNA--protein-cysteine methyltransferase